MRSLGDAEALDRLVLEHLPGALRFATRLTGDADTAEELLQEALVRVARNWAGFRGESQFRTWLYGILVNAFRDRLRRPRMALAGEEWNEERFVDASAVDPAVAAMAGELGELIARHVSALPPRQREVLVLIAYEQLSPREVAQVTGTNEANVHSTLHLARAKLKRQLAAYLGNE